MRRRRRAQLQLTREQLLALALLAERGHSRGISQVVRDDARSALPALHRALVRACAQPRPR